MSGFTKIPNTLLDRTDLDVYEYRAMMIIARKTMGWGKLTDGIPHSQFMDAMQSSKHTVIKAIGSLESKGLIEVVRSQRFQGKQGWNQYRITDAAVNEANPHLQSAPDAPRNTQSAPDAPSKQSQSAPDAPRQSAPDAPCSQLQSARRAHSKETLISSKETHSKETHPKENEAKASSMSVGEVVDLYHEILPSLPSVLKITDARRKAITARIHDDLKTPSEWRVFFSRVGKSDFLTGKADNFRADLEWLCKPSNFLKVREGRYDPKNATSATTERSIGINNPPPPRYLN